MSSLSTGAYQGATSHANGEYLFSPNHADDPLSDEHFIEIPQHNLNNLPQEVLGSILTFLSVKDRFSFKEVNKQAYEIGSYVELLLLSKAFRNEKAEYAREIIATSNTGSYYERLRKATKQATLLARNSRWQPIEEEEPFNSPLVNRISPDTYRTYALAIQRLQQRDRNLIAISDQIITIEETSDGDEKSQANWSEREQAAYLRNQIRMRGSQHPFPVGHITRETPEEVLDFQMTVAQIKEVLKEASDQGNEGVLFRLIERNILGSIVEQDPDFFRSSLIDLKRALKIAVKVDRIASTRNILQIAGRRIRGFDLGVIQHEAIPGQSLVALQEHARGVNRNCANRVGYHFGRKINTYVVCGICTLITIMGTAFILLGIYGHLKNKGDDSP